MNIPAGKYTAFQAELSMKLNHEDHEELKDQNKLYDGMISSCTSW
jgi:hypothetical protein